MKVKELIKMLMDCDPEATVYVEANRVPNANIVKTYHTKIGTAVYIADETDYIDEEIDLDKNYKEEEHATCSLDLFLEDEIPYRLTEILKVSKEDAEKVKDEILDKLCVSRGGAFNFFDYDAFDRFIADILDERKIAYER